MATPPGHPASTQPEAHDTDPAPLAASGTPPGLVLAPFRGLRYALGDLDGLAALTAPPYDVIDAQALRHFEAASPHNVVRLTLPRDVATGASTRYAQAAARLAEWRAAGILRRDPEPALYVYEESGDGHVQRGLVGAIELRAPADGVILPHEDTMPRTVADRLALMRATEANLEPIFLVYAGGGPASQVVDTTVTEEPITSFTTADDRLTHRLWAITDPARLAAVAADLAGRQAVIADGHHRYATYLAYQGERRASGAGRGPWDFGLALLVDADAHGPQVQAIHRVLPGLPAAELARRAERGMRVTPVGDGLAGVLRGLAAAGSAGPAFAAVDPRTRAGVVLSDPDPARVASALPGGHSAQWARLDVTVCHHYLISELLGLPDTPESIGYAHGVEEALRLAEHSCGSALLLNPTPVHDVLAVASQGERMPRKSTLFLPKPRTGLVLRTLERA